MHTNRWIISAVVGLAVLGASLFLVFRTPNVDSGSFVVPTVTRSSQKDPQVGMAADGSYVVVWATKNHDQGEYDIAIQRYDARGVAVGKEQRLNTTNRGHEKNPWIDVNGSGRLVAVWDSWPVDGSDFDVRGRIVSENGTPIAEDFLVHEQTDGYQWNGRVAMNDDGSFMVVWMQRLPNTASWSIMGRAFDSSGLAQGDAFFLVPSLLHSIESEPNVARERSVEYASESAWLDVAGNGKGLLVVAWVDEGSDGNFDILARVFDRNGQARTPKINVNQHVDGSQQEVTVDMNHDGAFIVSWMTEGVDRDAESVAARRFALDGTALEDEWQVNSFETDKQGYPAVAIADNGSFLVAWESDTQDGDRSGVFARRFDRHRAPLGDTISLSAITHGWQEELSVDMNSVNLAVATWMSFDDTQDTNGRFNDVYARRLDPLPTPAGESTAPLSSLFNRFRHCTNNSSPIFTRHLTDIDALTLVTPPGNTINGHLKTHAYLWVDRRIPVYAPVDSVLTDASYYQDEFPDANPGDYLLGFTVSCEVRYKLDHITEPIDKIRDQLPREPILGDSSTNALTQPITFAAGDLIGYTYGTKHAHNWDFGVYNATKPAGLGSDHAICPFDYFLPELQSVYVAKLGNGVNSEPPPTTYCNP
jgi:hypothetical protein